MFIFNFVKSYIKENESTEAIGLILFMTIIMGGYNYWRYGKFINFGIFSSALKNNDPDLTKKNIALEEYMDTLKEIENERHEINEAVSFSLEEGNGLTRLQMKKIEELQEGNKDKLGAMERSIQSINKEDDELDEQLEKIQIMLKNYPKLFTKSSLTIFEIAKAHQELTEHHEVLKQALLIYLEKINATISTKLREILAKNSPREKENEEINKAREIRFVK